MHVLNEWHLQGQCHHDLPLKKMSKNELPLTQGNKGGGGRVAWGSRYLEF